MQDAEQGFKTPQHQIQHTNFLSPRSTPQPPQSKNNAHNSSVVGPCYSCGQTGHYANRCPSKQAEQTPAVDTNSAFNSSSLSHVASSSVW
jgi:hypothetical protein